MAGVMHATGESKFLVRRGRCILLPSNAKTACAPVACWPACKWKSAKGTLLKLLSSAEA